jgi:hypothetical protein
MKDGSFLALIGRHHRQAIVNLDAARGGNVDCLSLAQWDIEQATALLQKEIAKRKEVSAMLGKVLHAYRSMTGQVVDPEHGREEAERMKRWLKEEEEKGRMLHELKRMEEKVAEWLSK